MYTSEPNNITRQKHPNVINIDVVTRLKEHYSWVSFARLGQWGIFFICHDKIERKGLMLEMPRTNVEGE